MYWDGTQYRKYDSYPKPDPNTTQYICSYMRYVHGKDTPLTIPRTLDLYIRTLGRITVNVMLCPGYALYDSETSETPVGDNTSGSVPLQIKFFITYEDVSVNQAKFWLERSSRGNNTIKHTENFTSFSDSDSDLIDLTSETGFKFAVNERKKIEFRISDVL